MHVKTNADTVSQSGGQGSSKSMPLSGTRDVVAAAAAVLVVKESSGVLLRVRGRPRAIDVNVDVTSADGVLSVWRNSIPVAIFEVR